MTFMILIIIVFCVLYTLVGVIKSIKKEQPARDLDELKRGTDHKDGRKLKLIQFVFWKWIDLIRVIKFGKTFNEYGLTMYCGRQGAGKTISMVHYLEEMRAKYPLCKIGTNFGYINEDFAITGWEQFFEIRNGVDGVIFAFDELQNEWDSSKWDKFPEGLLRQVTMQRKQRIKIVATSQVYTRVVKALREQCFEVVECYTFLGRWTFCKAFDADDYNTVIDDPDKKRRLFKKWKKSFIQTDVFRELYDTNLVIEKIRDLEPGQKSKERKIVEMLV